ncbi:MAG: hypothetical protein Q9P01_19685 [Anaerolineae bacterium]|nr:hypothetical protein [Anaerolineae bacterium]
MDSIAAKLRAIEEQTIEGISIPFGKISTISLMGIIGGHAIVDAIIEWCDVFIFMLSEEAVSESPFAAQN